MKKKWLVLLSKLLLLFMMLLFFKGCSSFNAVSSGKNVPLEDSIKFSNIDSIKFIGIGLSRSIPIVKLYLGFYGRKYFIVDTGSTFSIIDSAWIHDHESLIEYVRKIDFIRLQSFSERTSSSATYAIKLPINGIAHEFIMLDIKSLREKIYPAGFDIIGIIGSDFLSKNKYIIDYNKRCIYKPAVQ